MILFAEEDQDAGDEREDGEEDAQAHPDEAENANSNEINGEQKHAEIFRDHPAILTGGHGLSRINRDLNEQWMADGARVSVDTERAWKLCPQASFVGRGWEEAPLQRESFAGGSGHNPGGLGMDRRRRRVVEAAKRRQGLEIRNPRTLARTGGGSAVSNVMASQAAAEIPVAESPCSFALFSVYPYGK
jgi:hypothetical protein